MADSKIHRNISLILYSYQHLNPLNSSSCIKQSVRHQVSVDRDVSLKISQQIFREIEIKHISKFRSQPLLTTSLGKANMDDFGEIAMDYGETGYIYMQEIYSSPDKNKIMIQVKPNGTIWLSNKKSIPIMARDRYKAGYTLDSRDLYLDGDHHFYFITIAHEVAIASVEPWLAGKSVDEIVSSNVISYYNNTALFCLNGNFLYTVAENCTIMQHAKNVRTGVQNLRGYWKLLNTVTCDAISEAGIDLSKWSIPTSICATLRTIAVIFYNPTNKTSKILVGIKSFKKFYVAKIKTYHSKASPCFHMTPVSGQYREYLLVPFKKGSLGIILMRNKRISKIFFTSTECSSPINGIMMAASNTAVVYGHPQSQLLN